MEKKLRNFRIASWSLILLGAGHNFAHFATSFGPTHPVFQSMRKTLAPIPGTNVSLESLHDGFSLTMGLMLVGYGSLNLMVANHFGEKILKRKSIFNLNAVIAGSVFALSWRYSFYLPIALSGLSTLLFLL